MIYALILVLSSGVTTVGTYDSLASCQSQLPQFQRQHVTAACVQQDSPEQAMNKALTLFKAFQAAIPKD